MQCLWVKFNAPARAYFQVAPGHGLVATSPGLQVMLYRSHLNAGLAAGAALCTVAVAMEETAPATLAALFALTTGFSLLPDVDVASIPQRWFYRGVLVGLAALIAMERYQEASLVALVAMLPLIHKHRGWMHRWWCVVLLPPILLLGWHGLTMSWLEETRFMAQSIPALLARDGLYWAAMSTGYAVHLVVDGLVPLKKNY